MRAAEKRAKCSDADFIKLVETKGPKKTAQQLGVTKTAVMNRRRNLERIHGRQITSPRTGNASVTRHNIQHAARLHFDVLNGVVLVGSDAHIWPGPKTTAMRAFIKFARELRPKVTILNGDVLDFPQVSRHPPIGWPHLPSVEDEIKAAQNVLAEIEDAVPSNCKLSWPLGNHDARYETRLATVAYEFARMHGFSLKDHFPKWQACWATWINRDVVVKHRFRSGVHAPHNNTVNSGKHIITGHLHSQKISPWNDYNGTRYGVDTGCLADPDAQAFVDYTEDGPLNWRSGFVVLTFHNGKMLPPELVTTWDKNTVVFRGELIRV
jgi:UDP-2,3-diacylglucosamine pyrophosphatase LpxH